MLLKEMKTKKTLVEKSKLGREMIMEAKTSRHILGVVLTQKEEETHLQIHHKSNQKEGSKVQDEWCSSSLRIRMQTGTTMVTRP